MKKTISGIMLTLLLMTVLMAAASAEGQINESSKIRFRAFAVGKCRIGYGQEFIGYFPDPEWIGIGRGIAGISGCAEAVPLEESALWPDHSYLETLGDTYVSENLKAWAFVSLSWKEDGSKHRLMAVLYATASTGGIFVPEIDYFTVPMLPEQAEPLRFIGIHASGSEIQRISGNASFGAWCTGPRTCSSPRLVYIGVLLGDESSQTGYLAVWIPEEAELPTGPVPEDPRMILVPAAKVFWRNVEVVSSP